MPQPSEGGDGEAMDRAAVTGEATGLNLRQRARLVQVARPSGANMGSAATESLPDQPVWPARHREVHYLVCFSVEIGR